MIPSRQLDSAKAIGCARQALGKDQKFVFGNVKLESEFFGLALLSEQERYMAVDLALQEITPLCRLGPQPPGNLSSRGQHLYAFYWPSVEFKRNMYFKFELRSDAKGTHLILHSFHESTDKESG